MREGGRVEVRRRLAFLLRSLLKSGTEHLADADLNNLCRSEFVLLAGSAITLILVLVFSVKLLSNIGSEPLPSQLASVGGAGMHGKRD